MNIEKFNPEKENSAGDNSKKWPEKYNVGELSQQIHTEDLEWKNRTCGIASIKILMEYNKKGEKIKGIDELVKQGLSIGAYIQGIGWVHKGLADITKKNGFNSESFDWFEETDEDAKIYW